MAKPRSLWSQIGRPGQVVAGLLSATLLLIILTGIANVWIDRWDGFSSWLSLWVNYLAVISTAAVSIAAIWGDKLRHQFSPPKLLLALRRKNTKVETIGGAPVRYVHLEVSNENEWTSARNVEVVVDRVWKQHKDSGEFSMVFDVGPVPLRRQWHDLKTRQPDIGRKVLFDLGFLSQQQFKFEYEFDVPHIPQTIGRGDVLRMRIRAEADNCTSNDLVLQIEWDGKWSDDDGEAAQHLIVMEVSDFQWVD